MKREPEKIILDVPSTTAMEDIYNVYGLYDYIKEIRDGQIYLYSWERHNDWQYGRQTPDTHIWMGRKKRPEQKLLWNKSMELNISRFYLDVCGRFTKEFISRMRSSNIPIMVQNWREYRFLNTSSNLTLLKKYWHLFVYQGKYTSWT